MQNFSRFRLVSPLGYTAVSSWLIALPLATSPFPVSAGQAWNSLPPFLLSCLTAVCLFFIKVLQQHQRLRPAPHFWHSEGRPSLIFFVSHTVDLARYIQTVTSFQYRFCKVPPQLCDGSTIILTFLVVVVVVIAGDGWTVDHTWQSRCWQRGKVVLIPVFNTWKCFRILKVSSRSVNPVQSDPKGAGFYCCTLYLSCVTRVNIGSEFTKIKLAAFFMSHSVFYWATCVRHIVSSSW